MTMTWSQAVEILKPHVVRIFTPGGSGTGFLISNGKSSQVCGIATAAHVIDHAHLWEEPIRIEHSESGKSEVVRRGERSIHLDPVHDTAVILFDRKNIPFPTVPLPLAPKDAYFRVGNDVAWLGFPAIPSADLCFFTGSVSAWIQNLKAYLVDGVAINGVSGGPAFHLSGTDATPVILMGVVTNYIPNRATGEPLPGLSVVRDVSYFHNLAPTFASLEQAQKAEPPVIPPLLKPEVDRLNETPAKKTS